MRKAATGSEIAPRPAAPSGTDDDLATSGGIGDPVPLVDPFGPLVRQRWGAAGEIFPLPRRKPVVEGVLCGLGAGAAAGVTEFFDLTFPWNSLGFAAGLALAALPGVLKRWREHRLFSRAPRAERLDATPGGTLVRITGTVETEGKVFETPGTRRTVVYSRIQFWHADARERPDWLAREEIRAVPFRLRIAEGMSVRLEPEHIRLLDQPLVLRHVPADVCRALGAAVRGSRLGRSPHFQEAAIAPGDSIEAIGHLHAEVNVDGAAAPARGIPLVYMLGPIENQGVLVRSRGRR